MAKIVLAVASSISLYKSLELVSALKKDGHEVRPLLTRRAAKLISPALFGALAGHPAAVDEHDDAVRGRMTHIDLARGADLFAAVPATANVLAKLAHGMADDLLSTTALAATCPVYLAPAMNPAMWAHPAVRANADLLRSRGALIAEPDAGVVACGDEGRGKLASVDRLLADLRGLLGAADPALAAWKGKTVAVTAGGSEEYVDPVRVLANRSSGKMARALALGLAAAGARVLWVQGRIEVPPPPSYRTLRFTTTADLGRALEGILEDADALFMAAAPGDFKAAAPAAEKIKRGAGPLTLALEPNADLLAGLPPRAGQLRVAFAAETSSLRENAAAKLAKKHADLIFANRAAGEAGGRAVGLGADHVEYQILDATGPLGALRTATKEDAAADLLRTAAARLPKT